MTDTLWLRNVNKGWVDGGEGRGARGGTGGNGSGGLEGGQRSAVLGPGEGINLAVKGIQ